MKRILTSFFVCTIVLGLSLAAADRAAAQAATGACPPGQPCVVVVPQPPPQGQIVVQAQPQPMVQGYVVAQPAGYAPPQQRQQVERRHSRLRWGMIGPGIGLIVGGWFGNWITGVVGLAIMASDDNPDAGRYFGWSWVPWVGPFVNAGYFAGTRYDGVFGMHLLWGVLQATGLVLCILGTVLPEEEVTYEYVLGDDPNGPRLSVLPWASDTGAGLTASIAGF